MSTLWNSWGSTFLVALLAGFSLSAEFASAQDVQASILVETGGQPSMSMDYRANARGVRVDITQSQPLSIIWMQGPPPKILLLQHANRRYIELGEPMFQMMQQLMQQMTTTAEPSPNFDIESLNFEETGRTQTVGSWTASEIHIAGLGTNQAGTLWIAPDLDIGLFELLARMTEPLDVMQIPMLGGVTAGPQRLIQFRQMGDATNLPSGGAVRLTVTDPSETSNITLQSLERVSFSEDPFAPPAGYEPTQMPSVSFPE
ncbi:MAG: hypothetical protein CL484_10420 [Acidobacteria bacterium]|nr:hypothetical protein [Acidobacteriota bacterium]|tara:strand:- start:5214 stop:5987 length:774 start_codon:yes stop_codon:yes gene_type:complete